MRTILPALFFLIYCYGPVDPPRAAAAEPNPQPNIVLLFIDDLGYGDTGPFGNTKVKTPHLDKFAAEGMKFTSFYATPVCSMSRTCLLTGCYNTRLSIPGVLFPDSLIGLHSDEVMLAERCEVPRTDDAVPLCVPQKSVDMAGGGHVRCGSGVTNPLPK